MSPIPSEPSTITPPPPESLSADASGRRSAVVAKVSIEDLSVLYSGVPALRGIHLTIPAGSVTAVVGPAGCGKTTLIRCLNRMHDLTPEVKVSGTIRFNGRDIHDPSIDVAQLRAQIGMVLEGTTPFPKSIFENIAYGPRLSGIRDRRLLLERVKSALQLAGLWDEVEAWLDEPAGRLTRGQKRRLCIARTLATHPEVVLMDETASLLDAASTARVEDLIFELKGRHTLVVVTNNLQQAARVSDYIAFLCDGELIEAGRTNEVFTRPRQKRTEEYLTGRFG